MATKVDVYQIVTDQMITALEEGTVPWQRPWSASGGMPRNLKTGKPYRGVNVVILACAGHASPYWCTYKQAKAMGGQVRKGEKSTVIVFWKFLDSVDKETGKKRTVPLLRYYRVFNVSQCEGLEGRLPDDETADDSTPEVDPIDAADAIVDGWSDSPAILTDQSAAWYRPSTDEVGMPDRQSFTGSGEYYSTLFHELTHSTGHKDRLAREGLTSGVAAFGSQTYSKEELVAEMGAAFMCSLAGIEGVFDNSAAYVCSWIKKLKSDPKLIVQAGGQAQKAVDMITGTTFEK